MILVQQYSSSSSACDIGSALKFVYVYAVGIIIFKRVRATIENIETVSKYHCVVCEAFVQGDCMASKAERADWPNDATTAKGRGTSAEELYLKVYY